MIKILHIAKPVAGVGIYIQLLSKFIDVNKFKNEIILNKSDSNLKISDKFGNDIKSYHLNLEREVSFIKDLVVFFQLLKLVKKIRPDVIHCHSAKAGILGRLVASSINIPCLYTPHAFSYLSTDHKLKKRMFKFIEKCFKYSSSKILACSKSEYNRAVNELKFSENNVLLWENSLPKFNTKEMVKSKINLPKKYICTIGRPSYQKNTELLIETIYKVKDSIRDIHLVVLGVGFFSPKLQNVKNLIDKYDLSSNITLIDWIDRKEILTILNSSDFFVSSSRYEGLSYAGLEALMLSKPGVLTNVDGNKDLIEQNKNGFLVDANSTIFADKIVELYNSKDLIRDMSIASKKKFENEFNLEKNIPKLERIYYDILSN